MGVDGVYQGGRDVALGMEKNVRDLVAGHCVEMLCCGETEELYRQALSVMVSRSARFGQDDMVHGPSIRCLTKI
jgi:hypothetical protein